MEENFQPQKPFFKTGFGIVLGIILGLLAVILLTFTSFFSYYLYQQKYGSEEKQKTLANKFNPTFTKATGINNLPKINSDKNVASYIRPYNSTLGANKAPITIVAFIDFECPYSKQSFPIFENVIQKFGSSVRVVFKNFPIESIHPNAKTAALQGLCLKEQNQQKFWDFYRGVFRLGSLDPLSLQSLVTAQDINAQTFASCFASEEKEKQILSDLQDGVDLGVEGTPTYFVNQRKVEGVADESSWNKIILEELQNKK